MRILLSTALSVALLAPTAAASPESKAWIDRAFLAAYNLDHADAIAALDKALAADPNDADAHRAAAVIAWLRIGFLRGSITVDDYLGSVSKPNRSQRATGSTRSTRSRCWASVRYWGGSATRGGFGEARRAPASQTAAA